MYKEERNREILRLRRSGMKLREIGEKYGICSETVRQICCREIRKEKWQAKEKQEAEAEMVSEDFENITDDGHGNIWGDWRENL